MSIKSIAKQILDECQGGTKVDLRTIKSFITKHPDVFKTSINLNELNNINPKDRRLYILSRICDPLSQMESIVSNPNAKLKSDGISVKPIVSTGLHVTAVTNSYLKSLKSDISKLESSNFTLKQLANDIANDDFVTKAVSAHAFILRDKLATYKKLAKLNWSDDGAPKPVHGVPGAQKADLNDAITKMIRQIESHNNKWTTMPMSEKLQLKRTALTSILVHKDHGISTIKGTSREDVRIMLVKLVYMFIKAPIFFSKGFINFMVTGPAGSGKTKVAGVVAHLFQNLGVLITNNIIMATKQNLVAQYVGQSAPKTRQLLSNGLEGVVFVDEAYSLTPCKSSGNNATKGSEFSEEAVVEFINFVDKFAGCMVVIVAGYKQKMYECFLGFNEGMARRFPRMLDFIPYTNEDMIDIFKTFLIESMGGPDILSQTLSNPSQTYILSIIADLNKFDVFNNQAGDMLNLAKAIAEDAILQQKEYTNERIQLSFKRFCAPKQIAIQF